jgi:signal transduction histidine kinase
MAEPNDDERPGEILLQAALQFGGTLDLDRLLRLVVSQVADLVGAERALVALFDSAGEVQTAVTHQMEWDGPGTPLPVSHGVLTQVLERRAPVVVTDAMEDEHHNMRVSVRNLGLRLIAAVPVPTRERVIGVLYTDSQLPSVRAGTRQLNLMVALGRLVGTAVENAQHYEEERYRAVLLGRLVHDFRIPLMVIQSNAQMLEQGPLAVEQREMATDIDDSARRMLHMIEGNLALLRNDNTGDALTPQPLWLDEALPRHLLNFEIAARQRGLRVVFSSPGVPLLITVPEWLHIIVDNLVWNALQHATPGTAVQVSLAMQDERGPAEAGGRTAREPDVLLRRTPALRPAAGTRFAVLTVENQGPSVPPEVRANLFSPFVRGPAGEPHGSTGLGLFIVDQCVRHLGGWVWLDPAFSDGARMQLTLPLEIDDGGR